MLYCHKDILTIPLLVTSCSPLWPDWPLCCCTKSCTQTELFSHPFVWPNMATLSAPSLGFRAPFFADLGPSVLVPDTLHSTGLCRPCLSDSKVSSWKASVLILVVSCEQCLAS